LHGEQVAVATLTMARIQEDLLAGGPPQWDPLPITCTELQRRFGAVIGESCWREFEAKHAACARAPNLARPDARVWDEIRRDIRRALVPAATIASVLERAGCPTGPADIGLSPGFYATAVRNARFLRDRYTFLDLADDAGRLAALWPT
jgi:glycerol-1-phosphate dehydrogenase [NAD(P)+]